MLNMVASYIIICIKSCTSDLQLIPIAMYMYYTKLHTTQFKTGWTLLENFCHIRKHRSAEFECSSTKSLTNQFINALQTG